MSRIRRLAAAQAYARNRQQQRALIDQQEMYNMQRAEQYQQARRDRRNQRIGGVVQGVLGAGMLGAAAIPGLGAATPALLAGGTGMLAGGVGGMAGNSQIQSMAPMLAQTVGMAASGYADQQRYGTPSETDVDAHRRAARRAGVPIPSY